MVNLQNQDVQNQACFKYCLGKMGNKNNKDNKLINSNKFDRVIILWFSIQIL
jgi:hypothetical protein